MSRSPLDSASECLSEHPIDAIPAGPSYSYNFSKPGVVSKVVDVAFDSVATFDHCSAYVIKSEHNRRIMATL